MMIPTIYQHLISKDVTVGKFEVSNAKEGDFIRGKFYSLSGIIIIIYKFYISMVVPNCTLKLATYKIVMITQLNIILNFGVIMYK